MKDEVRPDDNRNAWRLWVDGLEPFPSASSAWSSDEVPYWRRNLQVHIWLGPARRACHRCTVSWKSTGCIILQTEKKETSRGCSLLHTVAGITCNGPWPFHAEDEVRAGVSCRHTWEPERVSPFHYDRSWTTLWCCLVVVLGGGLFWCVSLFCFCCPWPFSSHSFVYPWHLTLWYNDCHYRDDERSTRPKKTFLDHNLILAIWWASPGLA